MINGGPMIYSTDDGPGRLLKCKLEVGIAGPGMSNFEEIRKKKVN